MTQSCWVSLDQPFTLSPNGLVWPLVFLLMGSYVPFCFSFGQPWPTYFFWVSLVLLLTLHSHELLLILLGFPGLITLFSSLEFMGLLQTPYFLCLHYFRPVAALSHFSTSCTAYGYAISLFSGFFKPSCPFKAHLFISWAYNPLYLPLGPNGFAIYLSILCRPCCWGFSSFYLDSHKWPLTTVKVHFTKNQRVELDFWDDESFFRPKLLVMFIKSNYCLIYCLLIKNVQIFKTSFINLYSGKK